MFQPWKIKLPVSSVLAKAQWPRHPELTHPENQELQSERRALVGVFTRIENRARHARTADLGVQKDTDREIQREVEANIKRLIGVQGLKEDNAAIQIALLEAIDEAVSRNERRGNYIKTGLTAGAIAAAGAGYLAYNLGGWGQRKNIQPAARNVQQNDGDDGQRGR